MLTEQRLTEWWSEIQDVIDDSAHREATRQHVYQAAHLSAIATLLEQLIDPDAEVFRHALSRHADKRAAKIFGVAIREREHPR